MRDWECPGQNEKKKNAGFLSQELDREKRGNRVILFCSR